MLSKILVAIGLLTITCNGLWAQVATGTYANGTFDSRGSDVINVGNLNVHLSIPVLSKAGRGLPFYYALAYDSSVWYPSNTTGTMSWTPVALWGWKGDTDAVTGFVSYSTTVTNAAGSSGGGSGGGPNPPGAPGNGPSQPRPSPQSYSSASCTTTTYANWVYHDALGSSHAFSGTTAQSTGSCSSSVSNAAFTEAAMDGSGFTINVTAYTTAMITTAKGATIAAPVMTTGAGVVTDANGNQLSVDANGNITDTTGNVALTIAGSAPNPKTFSYKDTSGNLQSVMVNYKSYTVQTAFGCSGVAEYPATPTSLVESIVFPDLSSYTFVYEQTQGASGSVTGRLQSVQLPTGGVIAYAYTGGSNGITCSDGSTSGLTRSVAAVSNSGASSTAYSRSSAGNGLSHTDVVDGMANALAYDFVQPSNVPAGTAAYFLETQRTIYAFGNATALLNAVICYNAASSNCPTSPVSFPITSLVKTSIADGLTTTKQTVGLDMASGAQTSSEIDDVTANGTYPQVIAQTPVQTLANGATEVTSAVVSDALGTAASVTYGYDEATPTATSGIPSHVAVTGNRGNLTSIKTSIDNSGIAPYFQGLTYNDTGALTVSSDAINGPTQYFYDPAFVSQTVVGYPSPSSGVTIQTQASFDTSYTGLPLSVTGVNGATVNIVSYDALLRPTELQTPMYGDTRYFYTPNQTTRTRLMQAGTETVLSLVDEYGRPKRTAVQTGNSASPWYLTDTCYDGNNNVYFVSFAYAGTSPTQAQSCSGNGRVYFHDTLGRLIVAYQPASRLPVVNTYLGRTTQSQDVNGIVKLTQVDALGRTIGVCEVSTTSNPLANPTDCGMDIAGSGYLTKYFYSLSSHQVTVSQGGQTRTFNTDWLGRTIKVIEPESGTTSYQYSTSSIGLVVTRTRPKPNQTSSTNTVDTTTQYDSIGRVVSVKYNDGTTPAKYFNYDEFTAFSQGQVPLGESRGMLTSAMVGDGSAMSAFGYDPLGLVSNTVQCMPSNCATPSAYKTTAYTYDPIGNPMTASDGDGFVASYTYSIASEPLTVNSTYLNGGATPIVTGAQYGPFGPNSYSLPSGLTETIGYDYLGHVGAKFLCNGSSSPDFCQGGNAVYGSLVTWDGDRASQSFDSSVNQASTYTYDAVNRLASQTSYAGNNYNFTYAYDRYGNRTAQTPTNGGPGPTVNATYNTANNQITSLCQYATCNGSTPALSYQYDALGNVMYDGVNHYTYDAENKVLSDGTSTYVYDALNRRVRVNAPGLSSEYVYHPGGKRASTFAANGVFLSSETYLGSTPVALFAAQSTTGNGYQWQHQDWLGTERARTDSTGAVVGTYSSLPFGDGVSSTGTDWDPSHFTGLDTNPNNGVTASNSHAMFRDYNPTSGTWMSPDPYLGSYNVKNPQSFNRYAYVLNNPLSLFDHLGLNCGSEDTNFRGGGLHAYDESDDGGDGGDGGDDGDCGDLGGGGDGGGDDGSGGGTGDGSTTSTDGNSGDNGSGPIATFYMTADSAEAFSDEAPDPPAEEITSTNTFGFINSVSAPNKPTQPCNPATSHCGHPTQTTCDSVKCHREPSNGTKTTPCSALGAGLLGVGIAGGPWVEGPLAYLFYGVGVGGGIISLKGC